MVVFLTVASVASSAAFFAGVGKTFAPDQDEAASWFICAPLGSSIDYTDCGCAWSKPPCGNTRKSSPNSP